MNKKFNKIQHFPTLLEVNAYTHSFVPARESENSIL